MIPVHEEVSNHDIDLEAGKRNCCNESSLNAFMFIQERLVSKASHGGAFSYDEDVPPMVDKIVDVGSKEKQETPQNSFVSRG